jgi:signal transduction histidine kinase
MQLDAFRRTTSFRMAAAYGLAFALTTCVILGAVYLQSAAYLTRRVDRILAAHAAALADAPAGELRSRIDEALALNGDRTNAYGLFAPDGAWIAGNLHHLPGRLRSNGPPVELNPTPDFPAPIRLISRTLKTGDHLLVGRDVSQLRQLRRIIAAAVIWSGAATLLTGTACGAMLSLHSLRRLKTLQTAAREIAAGNLRQRLPIGANRDELDAVAGAVNTMMAEVERLMSEVKSSTDVIAHDLRTPLTRARARLHRLQQSKTFKGEGLARVTAEIDEVLDRFRAILRISELEGRERRAGFSCVDLTETVARVAELYEPLAEADGVRLRAEIGAVAMVEGDPRLLFEAVSNLVDNAIKFTGTSLARGGVVTIRLAGDAAVPELVVEDNGPGIPEGERTAVLQRFYRGPRHRLAPGSGLGLSVVAAIVRLHGFTLRLEDAEPGLRVVIACDGRGGGDKSLFTVHDRAA